MMNDGMIKKLYNLKKKQDILMSEIICMKNEIKILISIKIWYQEGKEKFAALYNERLIHESGNIFEG